MSWWNPFSWSPGGAAGDDAGGDTDGIWGGAFAAGPGFPADPMLGEGRSLGALEESGLPSEAALPSDIARAFGSAGAGILSASGDAVGDLRTLGAGLGEPPPVLVEAGEGAPGEAGSAGEGLGEEGPGAEGDWQRDVVDARR